MANYEYIGDGLYRGLAADTKPTAPVQQAIAFEIDTRKTYYFQSGTWTEAAAGGGTGTSTYAGYTWLIYKDAGQYKAKNGVLGTSPTTIGGVANPNSSMNALWGAIRSNFNLAGEETNLTTGSGAGGLIQFGRGVFTFTGEMLLDSTMTGGARGPAIVGQSKGGTLFKLAPTAPLTSFIHVKGMVEPIIRDIDIQVDDTNVTTNIVHIDAMSGASAGGLYENIRIFKSVGSNLDAYFPVLPPTGQRAFYLQQGTNNTTNTMHFAEFRKILIKDTEKGFDSVGIGNNSFMKFDGIYLWREKQGFTGDSEFKQSFLSNFIYQAADAGNYGDYCISLAGPANCVTNVTTDVIGGVSTVVQPLAATVIIQPGARLNRIRNIVNSGQAPDVINLSGSDTNIYDAHYNSVSNPLAQNRIGDFNGDNSAAGSGAFSGGFTTLGTGGTFNVNDYDATTNLGNNMKINTQAAAGVHYGIRTTSPLTRRRVYPCFTARFKLNTNSQPNIRFFLGLTEAATYTQADQMMANDIGCIGIMKDTINNNNFKFIRNSSGGGAPTILEARTSANAVIPVDVGMHRLWIYLDEPRAAAYVSLDDHTAQILSTDVPDTDTALYVMAAMESVVGTGAKTLHLGRMRLGMSR